MKKFLWIIGVFILMAGTCTKEEMKCPYEGEVVDMTGLDGCGIMIKMEDGKLLEIFDTPEELFPGTSINFDYEVVEDAMSICMAGEIVKITCLETKVNDKVCEPYIIDNLDSIPEGQTFTLISHKTAGTKLYFKIGVSGCDLDRDFKLHLSPYQMKSMPPQNPARLVFKAQTCEAYFTTQLCFEMKELSYKTLLLIKNGDKTERVMYDPS